MTKNSNQGGPALNWQKVFKPVPEIFWESMPWGGGGTLEGEGAVACLSQTLSYLRSDTWFSSFLSLLLRTLSAYLFYLHLSPAPVRPIWSLGVTLVDYKRCALLIILWFWFPFSKFHIKNWKSCWTAVTSVAENGFNPSTSWLWAQHAPAVRDWPVPNSVSEVRSFLEFVNYFRRFTPRYAELARQLDEITGKHAHFSWNESRQKSFE